MKRWNIALAFYQNPRTAQGVFTNLKKQGHRKIASIHRSPEGKLLVITPTPWAFYMALSALFLLFCGFLYLTFSFSELFLVNTVLTGLITAYLAWTKRDQFFPIDTKILERFKSCVLKDEILVLAQTEQKNTREILETLRTVESGHPLSFLLQPESASERAEKIDYVREPLASENLEEAAKQLALQLQEVGLVKTKKLPLLIQLKKSSESLRTVRRNVAQVQFAEQAVTSSAEWLLDNTHVIQGTIEEVQRNLPRKYYEKLPVLLQGPMQGYPRVYAIAKEIVKSSAYKLNKENIITFLNSFQKIQPLSIGELWAIPLMLRLHLIECLHALALQIDKNLKETELATYWGNRLLSASRHEPEVVPKLLQNLEQEQAAPSPHFAEEVLDHLYDEEKVIPLVKDWLEMHFNSPLEEIIVKEQLQKTHEEVGFASAIVSLITLSQLTWAGIFEKLSFVDAILTHDPIDAYSTMSFTTRDTYRHAIENLSRHSQLSETDIAQRVVDLAAQAKNEFNRHVGYYLVDKGRSAIEKEIDYRPTLLHRIRRTLKTYPVAIYIGILFSFTVLVEALCLYVSLHNGVSTGLSFLLAGLALIPITEIAIQLTNSLFSQLLPPFILPKMAFDIGIPEKLKTLLVVPVKVSSTSQIETHLTNLEVNYLANSDPMLRFGIFCDFADAPQKHMEEDDALLNFAEKGIEHLESTYGKGKFFLFYRQRIWSESERAWIGGERKRGKLECLNRYLVGDALPENILRYGMRENISNVKYVITLDADTQIPKAKAKQLIETISHPLNQAVLSADGIIERGYTIIQPRVSTNLSLLNHTIFSQIFADVTGADPYTQAISDIYQDLMHEGNYHGKGIYDVHAFHRLLKDRFPDEHILSHDLLEGAFVRVGFASDVILYDAFPPNYLAWTKRQHRWIRGDWQIIDWLCSWVPNATISKQKNTLSALNRWKILDNLRRSLLPITIVLTLAVAWIFSAVAGLWTALIASVLLLPIISMVLCNFWDYLKSFKRTIYEIGNAFLRILINLALLPHQAYLALDACIRVCYRRLISQRGLLEWTVNSSFSTAAQSIFLFKLLAVSLFGALVLAATSFINPLALKYAIPFCSLWIVAPFITAILNKSIIDETSRQISASDKAFLRFIARKTWRYFDDFVGPQTHWLPPDNYQAALLVEVAQRTSPTNIGLWLVAALSAHDLKYITLDKVLELTSATLLTLDKLEQYEGHLLNWYDTQTLMPLYPRYVSAVDSGNFLASLWTMDQGISECLAAPLIPTNLFEGIRDSCHVLSEELGREDQLPFHELLLEQSTDTSLILKTIQEAMNFIDHLPTKTNEVDYWLKKIKDELSDWETFIKRYFAWVIPLTEISEDQLKQIHPEAPTWRTKSLKAPLSLQDLATGKFPEDMQNFITRLNQPNENKAQHDWLAKLHEAMQTSQWLAGEKLEQAREISATLKQIVNNMNMTFLYNRERKLFTIGYHVDDCKHDSSYYDLLASEARIASLVSIAKGDVPIEHWWALGRPYSILEGMQVLLSWGGTMFEYLMPVLFNKKYPNSLLAQGCSAAVKCQIFYGKERGIPWGISEAAYSDIDSRKTYQYRSFGVPGLGFKRDLEEDFVVSPYSTGLALGIDPQSAIKNFKVLKSDAYRMLSTYGFYESIDFSREEGPQGRRGVVVYAYMAHHQSMTFIAINNLLHNEITARRLHANPYIMGVESLLYENPPINPMITKGYRNEVPMSRLVPISTKPILGKTESPDSVTPKVNLISNSEYSVMLTNVGGGYSRWGDFDITRWRSDVTSDPWGSFCYIKDMDTGAIWSTTYHPTDYKGLTYSASFKPDVSRIRRREFQLEVLTEVVVSPEDNAEIRLVTLANLSSKTRRIELTTYSELALAPHNADRAHPAFNKMFIQTEALPEFSAIIAYRRLRSPDDPPIWAGHVFVSSHLALDTFQYETDRYQFIGRGETLKHPKAMDGDLSNTTGTVLDPIFSLRTRVFIEPSQRIQVSFITVVADSREKVIELIKKYHDLSFSHRAFEMAWTYAQLELRHLRIQQEEAQLYQKLAGRILYPHAQLRPPTYRLRKNQLGQSNLWAHGISGDLPIVVVSIADFHEIELVRQALTAHTFWRLRGLKTDLIILCEEATSYASPLFERLQIMIHSHLYHALIDQPGGVFLRTSDKIPEEELVLIFAVANVNLIAARGSFRQQLVSPPAPITTPPRLLLSHQVQEEPSQPLPFIELPYFNGIGGFTPDGKEYVIYLGPNTTTPTPWINVIANPLFGTLVSESGLGSTWYGNSQTNRLTPWSNDPVLNPMSDTLYIRDEELGTFWTPTPAPIRELDAYRIRHGQGYTRFEHNSHGINQELTIFVPTDAEGGLPLRIQRLRLTNPSSHQRKLSVTAYSEWVLGNNREESQIHIITEWDLESQALFATNRYHNDYGSYVAFASCTPLANSFTANRTEFLGRNHTPINPIALKRKGLSGFSGAATDSCGALQVMIELAPGEEKELIFVLGYAETPEKARELIFKTRDPAWVDQALLTTQAYWDQILGCLQVDTPELFLNFALNRWLLYQNLSCRIWGRSAFYQSSGAYGFRDQLQDVMALLYAAPHIAREQILRAAAHQFIEGDVQHWWHPPSNGGVRTRITDDLLWLPYVTAQYVRVTSDTSILNEVVPFLKGETLTPEQHEAYFVPEISEEKGTLLEHCRRAMYKGITAGPHGLPLIGSGDWNDGMNRVGIEGKGESVWLAWFLVHVMNDFAELLDLSEEKATAESFRAQGKRLAQVIEDNAWDGAWYRRAYFDDGTPLGSAANMEDRIDCLPQAWAVISGAGDPERSAKALASVEEHLIRKNDQLILLLTPAFDKTSLDPGYIKGYPPGVRENGGQYTHGSLWVPLAFALRGEGTKAAELLSMMHPVNHTRTVEGVERYKAEPYVLAGDVYSLPSQLSRGGWSWYSGSCGWMYRIWIEEVLGFKLRGDRLFLQPNIPSHWDGFKIFYHYRGTPYTFIFENPQHLEKYHLEIEVDGIKLKGSELKLIDNQQHKEVKVKFLI